MPGYSREHEGALAPLVRLFFQVGDELIPCFALYVLPPPLNDLLCVHCMPRGVVDGRLPTLAAARIKRGGPIDDSYDIGGQRAEVGGGGINTVDEWFTQRLDPGCAHEEQKMLHRVGT